MFPDFKELLSSFNAHGVKYLIVGGYPGSEIGTRGARLSTRLERSGDPSTSLPIFKLCEQIIHRLGQGGMRENRVAQRRVFQLAHHGDFQQRHHLTALFS